MRIRRLFLCEKPKVGRQIAPLLGSVSSRNGCLFISNGDVVTWTAGHAYENAPAVFYDKNFKPWARENLPLIPSPFVILPKKSMSEQLAVIKKLLADTETVVSVGDPDREGNLLIDEILEQLKWNGPTKRIMIKGNDEKSLIAAIADVKDNRDFATWTRAARLRSQIDWIAGINHTVALTVFGRKLGIDTLMTVGRVQTPLLYLIVMRKREIQNFKPTTYIVMQAAMDAGSGKFSSSLIVDKDATGVDSEGRIVCPKYASSVKAACEGQSNTSDYKFDIWADTEKAVKALLSPEGSVVGNQAAGTITVRDRAENVRQVSNYIAETNKRLSRQIALLINVWALEVSDENEAGLDLQAIFANDDVSIVAGSLSALGGPGTASATIVSGKLKDSTGVLKALKEWGNATQATSGGGLAVSNQPLSAQAIQRINYIAGSSTSQSDYGQTTEITPGEVTTGFSMTVIPHILDRRRVLLQYTINLVLLDELSEYATNDLTIQLPKTSTRAFTQRSSMQMGQTLILAGFQDQTQKLANSMGLFSFGRGAKYGKTLLVITMQLEAAGGGTED